MRLLKILLIFLLFSLVIAAATFEINDPDTMHYLANGKYIIEKGLPRGCIFGYTSNECQIAMPEWLFHAATYLVYSLGQWPALVIFQILLVLSIFLALFWAARRAQYGFFSTIFFLILAVLIGMERFMLRADLFSILIAVLLYLALKFNLKNDIIAPREILKIYLAVLPLQILWANTHGSFPLGFIIIGAFFGAEIIKNIWQAYGAGLKTAIFSQKVRVLGVLLLLAIAVSLLNPYGLKSFLWPFKVMFKDMGLLSVENLEFQNSWQPKDFTRLSLQSYQTLIAIALLLLFLNIARFKLVDLLLLLPLFYLSIQSVRNISLAAIFSALILPGYLDQIISRLQNFLSKIWPTKKWIFGGQLILSAVFAFFILRLIFSLAVNDFYINDQRSRRFGLGVSEIIYPAKAAKFIEKNNLSGNLFNDYGVGTYLNWRLFPRRHSFIDGHTFLPEPLKYYRQIMTGAIPHQEAAEKYQINYFILNHSFSETSNLIRQLYRDKNWALIYFDELSVIFIANKPENQTLINQYAIDFANNKNFDPNGLKAIERKVNFTTGYSFRGAFFANLGFLDKAVAEFTKAVETNQKNYIAFANLGAIYAQLGKDEEARQAYETSIKIESRYAVSHFNLALLYQKKGFADEAIKEYQKALKINRAYRFVHYNLGALFENKNNLAEAQRHYAAELRLNPNNAPSQNALNRLKNAASQKPENIEELQKSINENPQNAELYLRLGIAYGLKENTDKALSAFQRAIELNPNLTLAHFNLGNIYSSKNMPEEALTAYEKTLALDPKLAEAHLNLGIIYRYHKKNKNKVVEHWQEYLRLEPNDPQADTIRKEINQIVLEEIKKP